MKLQHIDTDELLAMADQQRAVLAKAQEQIDQHGLLVQTLHGTLVANPAVAMHRQATQTLLAIQRQVRITNHQPQDELPMDWRP